MNKAQQILHLAKQYNHTTDILFDIFKIHSDEIFDAIIIAPSWLPTKIFSHYDVEITCLSKHSYISSYSVAFEGFKLAWIQCSSSASSLIDHLLLFTDSVSDKFIFLGAVGGLVPDIKLGELVTPLESYSFDGGSLYLSDSFPQQTLGSVVTPHNTSFIESIIHHADAHHIPISKRKVFCTDSIICEYMFLDFIKDTGAEVIEMETAAFYKCMELMNKNGIALLCVSDNSASNISLTSKTETERNFYYNSRTQSIPQLIKLICEQPLHI